MSKKIAIQMDPLETIQIDGDSSFVMGLEAQRRGYELFHYHPKDMSQKGANVSARMQPVRFQRVMGSHYQAGEAQLTALADMDVILLRQDPPFDMSYITTTHMLDLVHPKTLVVNNPTAVRNKPEKIYATEFPELMPPTLISLDRGEIDDFRAEHKDIIIKPLFGNGGSGIFHLSPEDENLSVVLEMFAAQSRDPLMIQRYLPAVKQGDKRIILADGKPIGAVSRMPADGEARANFHAGGAALATDLTIREQEICEAIGPSLQENGLIFVGIDVIGDYMTEINVTSPTGLQEINNLNNLQNDQTLEAQLWDAIEGYL